MINCISHGDIYFVNFAPSVGHEFQGIRPAVVIQSNKQLAKSNLVTVMPLTSKINKAHRDDVLIKRTNVNGLFHDSAIKVHNIESFDQARFIGRIGKLGDDDLRKINNYLKIHFGI